MWSYLPHVPNTTKKPNPIAKRKSEVTDKEVLNLTGGLFPLKLVDAAKEVYAYGYGLRIVWPLSRQGVGFTCQSSNEIQTLAKFIIGLNKMKSRKYIMVINSILSQILLSLLTKNTVKLLSIMKLGLTPKLSKYFKNWKFTILISLSSKIDSLLIKTGQSKISNK